MLRSALALASGLWLLASSAPASSPDLRHIQPRGGQRGTELTIQLHGERLHDPRELLFHQPGIEVLELREHVRTETKDDKPREVRDGKRVRARIRIADDAPLGEHPVRLRTAGGVSYLRTLWVGQFPTVDEKEPNDSFDAPQAIGLNTTVQGVAKSEDEDFYSVKLRKGQPLSVEVEAMRLGRRFFDAYVAILDPDRFELAACDDAALLYTDAFASVVAPADGEYRIVVREAAYEGNDASQYRLHVGSFPRPAAVFPPGARPGQTATFRFIGDPAGELTREITIPADASGRHPVFAERDGLLSPSPNWIQVSGHECAEETEPNDGSKEASPAPTIPFAVHGVLSKKKDVDWFRFTAKKDENLHIRLRGRDLRSPVDSVLFLRDAKGKRLANNDDQGMPDSVIQWKCPADGEYFINVRDKLERSGADYTYRLEVERREPAIAATLPVAERNNSQARKMICIPRGGRYATVVNVARSNLGCDARFEAASLPRGVSLRVPPIPRSTSSFPVLFEAAADAPVDGGWHAFAIHSAGDNAPPVSGPLVEEVHHIEINNQGAYHSTRSEKIAVAVTEPAPFSLVVDAPPAPLVARGMLRLGAHLQRAEGFDAPVTLRMLWNPPGIGSPTTVRIDQGKSEAGYEINANPDAPVAEWQVCVLAEADTPDGPVIVSSELVPLRVVDPWVSASIDLGATEQGRNVPVLCKLEQHREFPGKARAELLGLPHGATTQAVEFDKDTGEITFPVEVAADAAVGKHSGLFLRIEVPHSGARVLHQTGHGGTLRIDKPRPEPKAEAKPKEAAKPPPAKPAEKPLSRLEQLRRQAE